MQARIGNMDGLFIAHHNTQDMLGFVYWPVELISQYTTVTGTDQEATNGFNLIVAMAEHILKTVFKDVPIPDVRLATS
jgi:hypothetical protein